MLSRSGITCNKKRKAYRGGKIAIRGDESPSSSSGRPRRTSKPQGRKKEYQDFLKAGKYGKEEEKKRVPSFGAKKELFLFLTRFSGRGGGKKRAHR